MSNCNISIQWFHPFELIIFRRDNVFDDQVFDYNYGISLDTVNEIYYYSYDWGYGLRVRILGFGFDITFNSV